MAPPRPPGAKRGPRPPSEDFTGMPQLDDEEVELEVKQTKKIRKEKRASELLRRKESVMSPEQIEELLHDEEYHVYEEEKPKGLVAKVKNAYHKKIHEKKALERALVCGLAVSMLWASSLAVCRLLVRGFVPSPTFSQIEESGLKLNDTMYQESQSYERCVNDAFGECFSRYVTTRDAESERVFGLQLDNFIQLEVYKDIKNGCANKHDLITASLNILRQDFGLFLPNYTYTEAEDTDFGEYAFANLGCERMDEISRQQLVAKRAVDIAGTTVDASNSAVNNLTSQLNDRIAYDLQYLGVDMPTYFEIRNGDANVHLMSGEQLLGNLSLTLDELEACLGDGEFNGTVCPNNTNVQNKIDDIYAKYEHDYLILKKQAQEYAEDYAAMLAKANEIREFAEAVRDKIPGGNSDLLNELFGPPWDFSEVDLSALDTDFVGDLLANVGIDEELIERKKQEAKDALLEKVRENAEELDKLAEEIRRLQEEYNNGLLEDYDPPPVDYNETNADYQKNADELKDRISDDLGYVQNTTPDPERVDAVISRANESAANLLKGARDRDWDIFGYPELVFKKFKVGLNDFTDYAVLFDTVWRVMQSVLLVKKYWSISGINTPPADVRADAGTLHKDKKTPLQIVAAIITHPVMQLINTAVWLSLLTSAIYLMYEPLYSEYVKGCVQHSASEIPAQDDGTMIYRNMLTATLNFALSAGDQAVSENIDVLNLERQFSCRDYFEQSALQRAEQNQSYVLLNINQNVLVDRFTLYSSCVDWERLDDDFDVVNLFGFALNDVVFAGECLTRFETIDVTDNLLHNCTNIQFCKNECPGVSRIVMANANHECACTLEWGMHSYFLTFLFAVAIYICVNVSRFYIMRGLIAVWWKRISIDIYSYLASCTRMGTIIPPKRVTEDGEEFADVIKDELDKALGKFSRTGYLELTYAFLINLPWIIFISIITRNLKYDA